MEIMLETTGSQAVMCIWAGLIVTLVCRLRALVVAKVVWQVSTCASLTGDTFSRGYALRPIVSINLKSSGYKMTPNVGEDGKLTINLSAE